MLRQALAIAAWAVGLELAVVSIWPIVSGFAAMHRVPSYVVMPLLFMLFIAFAKILFLAAFRGELAGTMSTKLRQRSAMLGMTGEAMTLLLALGSARNMVAFNPAQYWSEVITFRVIPSLCWIALFRIFSKEPALLSYKYTRFLAGVLCALELLIGLRTSYTVAAHLSRAVASSGWKPWNYGVVPLVSTLGWASLAFVLFAIYRESSAVNCPGEPASLS